MADNLNKTMSKGVVIGTIAATTTSSSFAIGKAKNDVYTMVVNTTAASGTTPTMDIVVQSSPDKGTTYINLPLRTAQITAVTNSNFTFRRGFPSIAGVTNLVTADTGGALVKDCVFDPDYMKIKATVGGTNPSFTVTVYFLADPLSGN